MNASKRTRALLALGLSVLLSACATKTDLETLQNQNYRERQESRRTIQKLEEQLTQSQEDLRVEIQKSTSPVQERQANTWAELEALRVQVAKLQGRVDSLSEKLGVMSSTQAGAPNIFDMQRDVQNIKSALSSQFGMEFGEGAAPAADGPKAEPKADKGKQQPKEPEADKATDPAEALFAKADAAFKARKFQEAGQYFSEYATTFKKHPRTSESVFFVGECAYNLQDYGKAVLAYQEVIEKYPRSARYKSAVLKQGMAFYKIGKDKAGRAVLEDLVSRFPSSPEGVSAKKFLKEHK